MQWTGEKRSRRSWALSDLDRPRISSRRIHSVTAVSPSRSSVFNWTWIAAFPWGRNACIQTDVSTRTMDPAISPMGLELFGGYVERDRTEGVGQGHQVFLT